MSWFLARHVVHDDHMPIAEHAVKYSLTENDRDSNNVIRADQQLVLQNDSFVPPRQGAAPPMQIDEFPILRSRSLNLQTGLAAEGKASARNLRCIQYGEQEVELTYVEQLVELSQAKALCDTLQLLAKAEGQFRSADNFRELLDKVDQLLGAKMGTEGGNSGLDALARRGCPNGFYAKPRKLEVAACVNRLRTAVFS